MSNVIIRNINLSGWSDDAINVEYSTRVWVDHNNFSNGGYGVASTCNAGVYVERNYFENVAGTVVTQTGDSPQGNVKLLNNYLANSGTPASRNASSVAAIPYAYTVDANNTVKSIVTSGAGTGKI